MKVMRLRLLALALLGSGLLACGSSTPACGPATCSGCCDAAGICQLPANDHCGLGGMACQSCSLTQLCQNGSCNETQLTTGGGTSASGGTTSTTGSAGSTGTTSTSATTGATTHGASSGSTGTSAATTTGTTATSATTTGTTGTTGTSGTNQPPVIASFTANPMTLGPYDTTTLSAIVSDPDGANDLAGGTLQDPASGQTYGAFSTPGGQGTFTFSLSWSAINQLRSIDLPAGGGTRAVRAQFFDNHGHTVNQDLTLTLQCSPSSDGVCDGSCVDLATDPSNCGSCGNSAPDGGSCSNGTPKCASGHTDCNGTCVYTNGDLNNCGACGNSCAAWASQHGLGSTHLGCDFGSCVYYADQPSQQSCDALCASAGAGLSCFSRESCYKAGGGRTTYSNGACAQYKSASSATTCTNETPLSCSAIPAASISDCDPGTGTTEPGSFSKTYCSCSG